MGLDVRALQHVTGTKDQINSLQFTVERFLKAQPTIMAYSQVMSTSITLSTAFPPLSPATIQGSAAKPSEHLTMDPAMILSQQFTYTPITIPFHDHQNLSHLGRLLWHWEQCDTIPGLLWAFSCLAGNSIN